MLHACVHARTQANTKSMPRPPPPTCRIWTSGKKVCVWGLTKSPPGDSDEQPEFRQMETLLELEERQMTAKTILSKAALPGASNFSRDAVQAQMVLVSLGKLFSNPTAYILEQSQYRAIFCLLTANFRGVWNPKIILKSSQLIMLGHFSDKLGKTIFWSKTTYGQGDRFVSCVS